MNDSSAPFLTLDEVVDGYLDSGRSGRGGLHWAWLLLDGLARDRPDKAWDVLFEATQRAADDQELCDIGAGFMEDLLVQHGATVIDRVERAARDDSRFRRMLTCVWRGRMDESVWNRLQAVVSSEDRAWDRPEVEPPDRAPGDIGPPRAVILGYVPPGGDPPTLPAGLSEGWGAAISKWEGAAHAARTRNSSGEGWLRLIWSTDGILETSAGIEGGSPTTISELIEGWLREGGPPWGEPPWPTDDGRFGDIGDDNRWQPGDRQ